MTPAEARGNLAAALKAQPAPVSITVHTRQPSRITPPCVVLLPADPWIDTQGLPYGSAMFRFTAQVLVPVGQSLEAVADLLDGLVASVIGAALSAPGEWQLDNVSAPDITTLYDNPYPYADVNLSAPFTL